MALSTPVSPASQRRKKLLQDIDRFCGRYGPGERETVLLVGCTGAGKSAAVNTIAKVVNGEYFPIDRVGEGDAQTRTMELLPFENCGARTDLPRANTNPEEDEIFQRITPNLPHLLDFAGLDNVDTPELKEIFELLIAGYIPPGTTVMALERDQKKFGVGSLKSLYPTQHPEWKVTKVVFVQSCSSPIPTSLINCLQSTLLALDEGGNTIRFTGDVFLLITKDDLVVKEPKTASEMSKASDGDDQRGPEATAEQRTSGSEGGTIRISMKHFRTIETTLARLFSIKGALEHNRLCWTSYHTGIGYDDENIDEKALEFIKLMVMPSYERRFIPPDTPQWTRLWLEIQLHLKNFMESLNLGKRDAFIFIMATLALLFVGWILNIKPS